MTLVRMGLSWVEYVYDIWIVDSTRAFAVDIQRSSDMSILEGWAHLEQDISPPEEWCSITHL